ncbi:MAG: hypothetical protein RBR69_10350 [Candidatus Cloacimonadaceae bacterium]|jgi:dipeptide/tripeptide permease|nr:DUF3098 domain-containing protein [Candidatus Cloacimonadota bacterium]MDY0128520.1 hypothetical protein [Candidatus Cloacimonadaceae bacterium]MCB5255271.1 DUF3098 domain-containing protein [Candidatus Cloacimonadota bacterium]MCK9177979.1 DUF3098 domain-containing protein [Candidatus Cloacimonadota bacterium]MCK9243125.1 DUF3098 domain-containing protein [Candidatus Cloacimonadota bacterium]
MSKKEDERLHLRKANYILLIVSAVVLILGYVIMSLNEITISPIILMIAYTIIIPFALLWHPKKK